MITIPPEVALVILENARVGSHPDKETLANCTLVCRAWRDFAQSQLFQEVHVYLENPRGMFDRFCQFLQSSPTMASYICSLKISHWSDRGPRWVDFEEDLDDDEETNMLIGARLLSAWLSPVVLMKLVALLSPNLALELNNFNLSGWPQDTPLPEAPARLRRLTLYNIVLDFKSPAIPFDLLGLFELDELVIEETYIHKSLYSTSSATTPIPAPAIQPIAGSVKVTGMDHLAMSTILNGGFDQEHLEILRLNPLHYDSFKLAEMMLRAYKNCVREVTTNRIAEEVRQSLRVTGLMDALASCTHLETLVLSWYHYTMTVKLVHESDQDLDNCNAFAVILAAAPRSVHHLTFSLPRVRTPDALAHILRHLLPRIEQAIVDLPGLRTIRLLFERDFPSAAATTVIHRILPSAILDGGMLQITDS
ncbi:hypothetical protein C2E23DRAFT_859020 [Lenzites betulinus]|nr:hypothetical protein C2E23DRAFT_859020 [Lenzites betulinus]